MEVCLVPFAHKLSIKKHEASKEMGMLDTMDLDSLPGVEADDHGSEETLSLQRRRSLRRS